MTFKGQIKVSIQMKSSSYSGYEVKLPNGMSTIMPSYANHHTTARIASLLAVAGYLGIEMRFTNWNAAKTNGVASV